MRRCAPAAVALLSLVVAAPAIAADNGEGLMGETDDKVITAFALGVVIFFILLVIVGSLLQGVLEKRKEARKAAELRQRAHW